MIIQFFCKVVEKTDIPNEYIVELDFNNKLNLPVKNLTKRKVYSNIPLQINTTVFISNSKIELIEDSKKLIIIEGFSLVPLIIPQQEVKSKTNLDEPSIVTAKKEMIKDNNSFPIHLLS